MNTIPPSTPIADFKLDGGSFAFVGQGFDRPECVLALSDGALVASDRRGAAMGVYQAVYGIGMFLGPVLAGEVIARFFFIADPAPPEAHSSGPPGGMPQCRANAAPDQARGGT